MKTYTHEQMNFLGKHSSRRRKLFYKSQNRYPRMHEDVLPAMDNLSGMNNTG
jgi:hypothetical protein